MDGIVDLETSDCPSTQLPFDVDCELGAEFVDGAMPYSAAPSTRRGRGRGGGEEDHHQLQPIRNHQLRIRPGDLTG